MNKYTENDSMLAMGFLITYIIFSYISIYWIKLFTSAEQLTRHNLLINLLVYLLPVIGIVMMLRLTGQSLNTIGLKRHIIPWILVCMGIFLLFHLITGNTPLAIRVILIFISEEIIFRGYAAERLKVTYGYLGSVLFSGVILGLTYSLIPIISNGITGFELLMYICIGLLTQIILQFFYEQYNNLLLPILLHAGIFTLIS